MHYWGDETVDWHGISAAAAYIGRGLRRWGRMDVRQYKEKYGTARVYCGIGVTMFHQLIWPGYVYNQYKWHWMWVLDVRTGWLWRWPNKLIVPFHKWLYRRYYRKARARWPHLAEEIYRGADFYELLGAKVKRNASGGGIIWWPEWDEEPEL